MVLASALDIRNRSYRRALILKNLRFDKKLYRVPTGISRRAPLIEWDKSNRTLVPDVLTSDLENHVLGKILSMGTNSLQCHDVNVTQQMIVRVVDRFRRFAGRCSQPSQLHHRCVPNR